jgi:hypothetical protein
VTRRLRREATRSAAAPRGAVSVHALFASVVGQATEQTYGDGNLRMSEKPEEIDPGVVEHVVAIRDRFGVRGLRAAYALIVEEIKLAEQALRGLSSD